MGQETVADRLYHRVLVTWNKPEPNDQDQYVAYIAEDNKRLERVKYTIRKNFMWTPQNFCGTAVYSQFKTTDKIVLPHEIKVYPFRKTDDKKLVHQFTIRDVQMGTFPKEELYPFPDLPALGDQKINP